MGISKGILLKLWSASGGVCAFPGCNRELICSETNDIIGHVCHIIAKKPSGPRGDAGYSEEELNSYFNLLLLCPTHHAVVDKDTSAYTVEKLFEMKMEHEDKIKRSFEEGNRWEINISHIYYLNIPRLASLPLRNGNMINMDILGEHKCLHDLGFPLARILSEYRELLNRLNVCAEPFGTVWSNPAAGRIISFDERFRTKNVPGLDDYNPEKFKLTGNLEKDPQLYYKNGEKRFILTLDPRWLATTTSFVNFKMGWIDVAGLAVIKYSDSEKIIASPYVIGTPKNDFWDAFAEGTRRSIKL